MQKMQKMTSNEAEWYGAECAIQDAMKHAIPLALYWATGSDFIDDRGYQLFVNTYYQTYEQTREGMQNENLDMQ